MSWALFVFVAFFFVYRRFCNSSHMSGNNRANMGGSRVDTNHCVAGSRVRRKLVVVQSRQS